MNGLVEKVDSVEVPRATGRAGFMHAIESILKLSRVQNISIDARGVITYKRFVEEGEQSPLSIDYAGLLPSAIIKHGTIVEVLRGAYPHQYLISALEKAASERLEVIAWATGRAPVLSKWCEESLMEVVNDHLLGLPVLFDTNLSESVLLLCTSFSRGASLLDCHRFFKIDMVLQRKTEVDVL